MDWNIERVYRDKIKASESLEQRRDSQTIMRQNNYLLSYHAIIEFAKEPITKNNAILLLNLAYGWMPRVARICDISSFDKLVGHLELLQRGNPLTDDQISDGVKSVGSLVGLSKILHFVAPDSYAIFDSNIIDSFDAGLSQYKINLLLKSIDEYKKYNDAMITFSQSHNIRLRDLEKVLFGYRDLVEQ